MYLKKRIDMTKAEAARHNAFFIWTYPLRKSKGVVSNIFDYSFGREG
jgi:hypothetical protein